MGARVDEAISKRLLQRLHLPGWGEVWAASPYVGAHHFRLDAPAGVPLTAKANAPEQLHAELAAGRVAPAARVIIGAHTDAVPREDRAYRITRWLLAEAARHPGGVSLWTRRLDALEVVIEAEAPPNRVRVAVGLSTLSASLAAQYEPDADSPLARLQLVAALAARGYDVELMLGPILPEVNDSPAQLESVIAAAAAAGAVGLLSPVPDLHAGSLEWMMPNLRALHPFLNPKFARRYRGPWPSTHYSQAVARFIEERARMAGLVGPEPPRSFSRLPGQLGLNL